MNDKIWERCIDFGILQKKIEFFQLFELLQSKNKLKNCLEIGCHTGGATYAFLSHFENVVSVDMNYHISWGIIAGEFTDMWTAIVGDSHSQSTFETLHFLNMEYDLIMIDGEHTLNGVTQDYEMYKKFLAPGGIIAFHDILETDFHKVRDCFVHELWQELKQKYEYREILYLEDENIVPENKEWGGIGVLFNVNKQEGK